LSLLYLLSEHLIATVPLFQKHVSCIYVTQPILFSSVNMTTLGNFRAIYLAAFCYIGPFLFAYDAGIVSGVLTLQAFETDCRYTESQATNNNSNCVAILQAGAFFGCFLA